MISWKEGKMLIVVSRGTVLLIFMEKLTEVVFFNMLFNYLFQSDYLSLNECNAIRVENTFITLKIDIVR